jgi:hypothetical protein
MTPCLIGQTLFHGHIANVYADNHGQFVIGNSQERVYGRWIPQDETGRLPTLQREQRATCDSLLLVLWITTKTYKRLDGE